MISDIMLLHPDFFSYATRKISIHDLFLLTFFVKNWLIEYLQGVAKLRLSSRQLISFICFGDINIVSYLI